MTPLPRRGVARHPLLASGYACRANAVIVGHGCIATVFCPFFFDRLIMASWEKCVYLREPSASALPDGLSQAIDPVRSAKDHAPVEVLRQINGVDGFRVQDAVFHHGLLLRTAIPYIAGLGERDGSGVLGRLSTAIKKFSWTDEELNAQFLCTGMGNSRNSRAIRLSSALVPDGSWAHPPGPVDVRHCYNKVPLPSLLLSMAARHYAYGDDRTVHRTKTAQSRNALVEDLSFRLDWKCADTCGNSHAFHLVHAFADRGVVSWGGDSVADVINGLGKVLHPDALPLESFLYTGIYGECALDLLEDLHGRMPDPLAQADLATLIAKIRVYGDRRPNPHPRAQMLNFPDPVTGKIHSGVSGRVAPAVGAPFFRSVSEVTPVALTLNAIPGMFDWSSPGSDGFFRLRDEGVNPMDLLLHSQDRHPDGIQMLDWMALGNGIRQVGGVPLEGVVEYLDRLSDRDGWDRADSEGKTPVERLSVISDRHGPSRKGRVLDSIDRARFMILGRKKIVEGVASADHKVLDGTAIVRPAGEGSSLGSHASALRPSVRVK